MILNMIFFKSYNILEIVIKLKLFFNEKHIHVRIQILCYFKANNPTTAVWYKYVYKIMDCLTLIISALLHW